LLQLGERGTNHGTRIVSLVGEFIHRRAKQLAEPRRTELDREDVRPAPQDKIGEPTRARPDHDRPGRQFLPARFGEPDDVSTLQIELEKLIGPRGDRANDRCVAYLRPTLLKAAHVVAKRGGGDACSSFSVWTPAP
jgi:hypothetical protein